MYKSIKSYYTDPSIWVPSQVNQGLDFVCHHPKRTTRWLIWG